ncbi:hypothetical protein FQZ97_944850 [compost metagenome]
MTDRTLGKLPERFQRPGSVSVVVFCAGLAFVVWSFGAAGISVSQLLEGMPHMGQIASEMVPP